MKTREELEQDIKNRCELLKQNFDSDLMKHGVDLGFINASYDLLPLIENLQRQNEVMREALNYSEQNGKVREETIREVCAWLDSSNDRANQFEVAELIKSKFLPKEPK